MSQEKQHPLRVRYEYEQEPDARLNYAHGVWGGINPHGEIEMNFYTESDKLPPFSERVLAPDGSFGHELAPYDENVKTVVRRIHAKLLLNYHTARAVMEWLEDKVDALEAEEEGAPLYVEEDKGFHQ